LSTDDSDDIVSCFERGLGRSSKFDFFGEGRSRGINFDGRDRSGSCVGWGSGRGTGREEEGSDTVTKDSTEGLSESTEYESEEVARVESVPAVEGGERLA